MTIQASLREAGDRLTKQIDKKLNPAISKQNHTPRRARIAAGMFEDGVRLSKIKQALHGLADLHDQRRVTAMLGTLRTKKEVENFLFHTWEYDDDWYDHCFDLGIYSDRMYNNLKEEVCALVNDEEYNAARRRTELFNKAQAMIGVVPGFYPTPMKIIRQMLDMAGVTIEDVEEIYDPTAGGGAILDGVHEVYPTIKTFGVERNETLAELCREKGHDVVTGDTFQHAERQYTTILANPPFEHDQDADQGCWYFDNLLAAGGKMVLITSSGAFAHTTPAAEKFQALVREHGYYQTLPAGSFRESKTGVNTCIVYLEKPGSEQGEEE